MADKIETIGNSDSGATFGVHDAGAGTFILQTWEMSGGTSTGTTTVVPSGTQTVAQTTGNWNDNIVQWNGTAAAAGPGLFSGGSPRVVQAVAGTLNISQVAVTTATTSLVASNTSRMKVTVINQGTTNVFLGTSTGVTTANGAMLAGIAGYQIGVRASSALWAVAASGTATVAVVEEVG
jgi:hypothetical protein